MDINLNLYKIFYTVAKHKNMTKASEELFISQPAISQSIKTLEEELGGALFLRSNKGMELTKEGEMFFSYIKNALELIKNAENEFSTFKSLDKGEIKIGCSTTLTKLVLIKKLEKFKEQFPNISIKLNNDLTDNLIKELLIGKLDAVIYNDGNYKFEEIKSEKLCDLKQGFVFNPKFFADKIKNVEDLQNYPLILQQEKSNTRKFLNDYAIKNKVILKPKMEVVSQELVAEFAYLGFGIGYTFIELAKSLHKELCELKINEKIPNINVFYAVSSAQTFATKMFVKFLNNK